MSFKRSSQKGFTLLELLIVIIILGVLATLISGNFLNSLKRGRDTRRKTDLQNIQKALDLYYEDKKTYPLTDDFSFGQPLCETNPQASCGTEKIYMQPLPNDTTEGCSYSYISSDGTSYVMYSMIENDDDRGPGVIQSDDGGYSGTSCGCGVCEYAVSSTNVSL